MLTSDLRLLFLDFFAKRGHKVSPSASLISNDPSVMFTIAGMLPFIQCFLALEPPPHPRVVSVQKCIRTSDIDEVGKTPRHGTFFQMMGNFSFGDYFKKEAIEYAWEFLLSELDLAPDRLWVTIHGDDKESERFWLLCGVPQERVQSLDSNFWSTGKAGPAGPCSEVFYDLHGGPGPGPEGDPDRYLEVWNLVFMQNLRDNDGHIISSLPKKCVDTGMGLERIAMITQGVGTIYDTDELKPILDEAGYISGKRYGKDRRDDISLRVLADHIRSSLMLVADGLRPSNEGRGYILRRLLRRSVRAAKLLGIQENCFDQLFAKAAQVMKVGYPELEGKLAEIKQVACLEEQSFSRALNAGTQLLSRSMSSSKKRVSGDLAFRLHDTHGFPIDLITEIAKDSGLDVDMDGFFTLMKEQKDRSRAALSRSKPILSDTTGYEGLRSNFLGYEMLQVDTKITALVKDGTILTSAKQGDCVDIALEQTPFYATAGGQEADRGFIESDNFSGKVVTVFSPLPGLTVHRCEIVSGLVVSGEVVRASVDSANRFAACQSHTATHVIHAVVREMFGSTSVQMGSYNRAGYLRFDFSCSYAPTDSQRIELEERANRAIQSCLEISSTYTTLEKAVASGAIALFGERYGDTVRMVEIGGPWSRELCAGTHLRNSSEIAVVSLVSETSVASGIRRVECLTGFDAFSHFAQERALVDTVMRTLGATRQEMEGAIDDLRENLKRSKHALQTAKDKFLSAFAPRLLQEFKSVSSVRILIADLSKFLSGPLFSPFEFTAEDIRAVTLRCKKLLEEPHVLLLAAVISGRVHAACSIDLSSVKLSCMDDLSANNLIKVFLKTLDGSGGGRADFAQGAGWNAKLLDSALDNLKACVIGKLSGV
ncbi:alanine--tRNA ligase [Tropheryma whipplei]|uniref:alanine--tRNA ligase n=1 Tax=Tropheryma whipplei TaxID=2039 RepID=UPI0004B285D0|nr:alanine--tRNA ligase [Tropheryma whipplei]